MSYYNQLLLMTHVHACEIQDGLKANLPNNPYANIYEYTHVFMHAYLAVKLQMYFMYYDDCLYTYKYKYICVCVLTICSIHA